MNNKTISFILFFLIGLFSCKNQNQNNVKSIISKAIKIDLSEFKELSKNNFSLVKDVAFFQLETNEKSLIGSVDKILATDKGVFILDTKSTNSIFNFDFLGKFLGKIGSEGNGPGEYSFLGDMDVDYKGDLQLLDLRKSKILKFQIDGKFINEKKFGFMTYKFAVLNKNSYIFDQGTRDNSRFRNDINLDYKLITWNPNLQRLNKFLKYTDVYDSPNYPLPNTHNIYRSGEKLNYLKPYEYNIYNLSSEDKIIETYDIDFGKHKIPKSFYLKYSNANEAKKIVFDFRKTNFAHSIINIFETSKYLSFNFSAGSNLYWVAISKNDNSFFVKDLSKMDLNDYPFLLCPNAVINDQFITILRPEYIPYLIEKYGEEKMKEVGLSILTEHKLNMNPIMVKWNLKNSFQ
ncbi:MAG: 6-bladed beta-propeller [Polaribacter sp.]|uniref:6-bladed beta-propeller n=1 Tax=Polaribacter sp. TaxID=1920175 RepID=UPI003266EF35